MIAPSGEIEDKNTRELRTRMPINDLFTFLNVFD